MWFFPQAVHNYFDENGQYFGQQPASSRQQAVERTLDIELEVIIKWSDQNVFNIINIFDLTERGNMDESLDKESFKPGPV